MKWARDDGTPIHLGLVGVGKIARDQHVPALLADPRFVLVATASHDGQVEGVPGYRDIAALLAGPERIDAVSICTPPGGRLEIAQAAIAAGVAVMLEKPPAATIAEAEAIATAAREAGVPLFTTWHSREAAGVGQAQAWLIGKTVTSVHVTWKEDVRRWHPGQEWIFDQDGFGVFDPGINALSIVTLLLPDACTVERAQLQIPLDRAAPIAAQLTLRSGPVAVAVDLDFLQTGPQIWDIAVETIDGSLRLSDGGATLTIDGAPHRTSSDGEYARLYRRFADLIAARSADVDLAPLRLVTEAIARGTREDVAPFAFA